MGSRVILVDCGEGTQRQLLHTSVSFMKITDIFITHFHGDHYLGLPALMQTMNLNERTAPLLVHGPHPASEFVDRLLRTGYFRPRFEILVNEVSEGDPVELGEFSMSAGPALHHPNVPALSYRLQESERPGRFDKPRAIELGVPEGRLFGRLQGGEPVEAGGVTITPEMVLGPPRRGRCVVFSGDTRPFPGLTDFASDCDILLHDATFSSSEQEKATRFGHSTAAQAAQTARDCGAALLFLSHFSPRYEDEEDVLLAEAKAIFPHTRMASDLEEFVVGFRD